MLIASSAERVENFLPLDLPGRVDDRENLAFYRSDRIWRFLESYLCQLGQILQDENCGCLLKVFLNILKLFWGMKCVGRLSPDLP